MPAPTPRTVENSVTKVIEQGMTGIDNLDYMDVDLDIDRRLADHAHLHQRSEPDTAQVQVQNKPAARHFDVAADRRKVRDLPSRNPRPDS